MKNNIKNSLQAFVLLAFSGLLFASCADWTTPESIEIKTPEVDKTLYADYLRDLKAYKEGDHKIVMVTFGNKAEMPASQAEHLTVIPDSVDYIILDNPEVLNEAHKKEMVEVRKKYTHVVYNVNFPAIEAEWNAMAKEDPELTEEQGLAYIAEQTNALLALCDEHGFDGITFTYMGRSLASLTEEALAVYNGRQQAFFGAIDAWRNDHTGKDFIFVGNIQYVLPDNRSFLNSCDYIVLATDMVNNADEITIKALTALSAGDDIPEDRFIAMTQTVRPDDDKEIYGYFGKYDEEGNKVRAIYGCANWVNLPSPSFTRAGLMINNVQNDYYNINKVYSKTREAIAIMNPLPKY